MKAARQATRALGVAALLSAAACPADGLDGQTGPSSAGTGPGTTTGGLTSPGDEDGIDPSVPSATSPGTGEPSTSGESGGTAGDTTSAKPPTSGPDTGADSGTTAAVDGSSDSGGSSSDDGLTFGTGGTQETLEFTDNGGLPTFGDTGTPATNCASIDVPADGFDTIVALEVETAFTHTWIGDVTIEVVAPDSTALTVLNRPGEPVLGEFGDDSDASASSPLTFADDATTSAEQMGAMLGAALTVCLSDAVCDYLPAPDAAGTGGGVGVDLGDFADLAADGQWQVCFTDHEDQDPLTVASVTLRMTKAM